jgi:hypothetical protein
VVVVLVDEKVGKPEAFEMQIVKVEQGRGCCEGDSPWWTGDAYEPPAERRYHVYPNDVDLDVVIIYPSVPVARLVPKHNLTQSLLPKTVLLKNVFAAVDLSGSGTPDLLVVRYCCLHPTASLDTCD